MTQTRYRATAAVICMMWRECLMCMMWRECLMCMMWRECLMCMMWRDYGCSDVYDVTWMWCDVMCMMWRDYGCSDVYDVTWMWCDVMWMMTCMMWCTWWLQMVVMLLLCVMRWMMCDEMDGAALHVWWDGWRCSPCVMRWMALLSMCDEMALLSMCDEMDGAALHVWWDGWRCSPCVMRWMALLSMCACSSCVLEICGDGLVNNRGLMTMMTMIMVQVVMACVRVMLSTSVWPTLHWVRVTKLINTDQFNSTTADHSTIRHRAVWWRKHCWWRWLWRHLHAGSLWQQQSWEWRNVCTVSARCCCVC